MYSLSGVIVVIYTNEDVCFTNRSVVFENIERIFALTFTDDNKSSRIHFVRLRTQFLLLPKCYPIFTLLGQALGSIVVGIEALIRFPPDIFIDTVGCAFTIPIAKCVFRAKTMTYVHYPTVSSDMLARIMPQHVNHKRSVHTVSYNNAFWIQNNKLISWIKFFYYKILISLYKFVGSSYFLDVTMTNSSWTNKHIFSLWGGSPRILYPPCSLKALTNISKSKATRLPWIMSIGQFRPEKNHEVVFFMNVK